MDYNFVRFSDSMEQCSCENVLPVDINTGINFFVRGLDADDSRTIEIALVTTDGVVIKDFGEVGFLHYAGTEYGYMGLFSDVEECVVSRNEGKNALALDDCFRLRLLKKRYVLNGTETHSEDAADYEEGLNNTFTITSVGTVRLLFKNIVSTVPCEEYEDMDILTRITIGTHNYTIAQGGDLKVFVDCSEGVEVTVEAVYRSVIVVPGRGKKYMYYVAECTGTYSMDVELYGYGEDDVCYSNVMRVVDNEEYKGSILKYRCNEEAFGIPYHDDDRWNQVLLPIHIYSPQYKRNEKLYTKVTGENVVLYAQLTAEYEGETEYLDSDTHYRIATAFASDYVYIDDIPVKVDGDYEIDWENCTTNECGEKIARAEFKAKENKTVRNSNG